MNVAVEAETGLPSAFPHGDKKSSSGRRHSVPKLGCLGCRNWQILTHTYGKRLLNLIHP